MRRSRRVRAAGVYVLTAQAHVLAPPLEPREEVAAVVDRVLARASRRTGVQVHDRAVWASGLRLVVDAPLGALTTFARDVLAQSARELALVLGWHGDLWTHSCVGPIEHAARGDPILLPAFVQQHLTGSHRARGSAEAQGSGLATP
jgi:hypothetical protein